MKKFEIDIRGFNLFPELEVHAFRRFDAKKTILTLDVVALLARAVKEAAERDVGQVSDRPVVSRWRNAYRAMGAKPSKFQSSIEALLRRVSKGGPLEFAIPLVSFYNAHSLMTSAPVGAYDVQKLSGKVLMLRPCRPEEDRFQPLGGEPASFPLSTGLIVYAEDTEVLCWGLNHRDSRVSALDAASEDVVFFSEAAFRDQGTAAANVIEAMRDALSAVGANCSPHLVANQDVPTFYF